MKIEIEVYPHPHSPGFLVVDYSVESGALDRRGRFNIMASDMYEARQAVWADIFQRVERAIDDVEKKRLSSTPNAVD